MRRRYRLLLINLFLLCGCQDVETEKKNQKIDLHELSIAAIHTAFREGKFTTQDLVEAYSARIKTLDSLTNAITIINPEAVSNARKQDSAFAKTGQLAPLQGIPILIKDNINTRGLPTTAGSLALQDYIPEEDAFVVQKLVDAGAIILAKTNMAEWAFSPMHTESSTAGITRNPYNLDYVPAGSSGGTAAGVAANFAVLGLGTDTGNSIRGPSSHCSLVGFRTTLGLISRNAIVPLYLRNDVVGPMSKTVEDATRVLDVIAGYDPNDPITKHSEGKIPDNYTRYLDKDGLNGARIGVLQNLSEGSDLEIQTLFKQALDNMKDQGAQIVDSLFVPDFDALSNNQWCPVFKNDLEDFLKTFVQRDTLQSIEDIINVGTTSDFARTRLIASAKSDNPVSEDGTVCGNAYTDKRRIAFRKAIEHTMDSLQLDALIYPSWNNKPARITHFQEEYKGDNSQIIAPHTGQPAFTVPMGFTDNNLPAGIQFLGRMFAEPLLIQLTYAYEQNTKHRRPPQPGKD